MKSLFLKIFLSFWVAQALFLVIALLVMLALRPQRNASWEALRSTALTEAIEAYEHGGAKEAHEYLENLQTKQHVRVYVFDDPCRSVPECSSHAHKFSLNQGPRAMGNTSTPSPWSYRPARASFWDRLGMCRCRV